MGKFTPTEKQEQAFKDVVKAFKKAKRLGLVFYGKSDSLVAYKKNADEYIESNFEASLRGGGNQVQKLQARGCLNDCGADDYGRYLTIEDQEYYS